MKVHRGGRPPRRVNCERREKDVLGKKKEVLLSGLGGLGGEGLNGNE